MAIDGIVPAWLLSLVAAATLWAIMFDLGIAIVEGEFRWVIERPGLVMRVLFSVLICVPCIVLDRCPRTGRFNYTTKSEPGDVPKVNHRVTRGQREMRA